MIAFEHLRWRNFLSAGNQWTEVELNTHKNTLIIGTNGAGKSTMICALTFALFGKPFRKITKGSVVNSINGKNCEVEIAFTIANKKYKVFRGLKPSKFEIYCNDKLINQDAAVRDYQEYLEKNILRMNYKSFTQIVILGSASYTPFMQLTAGDRRSIIEDLLDIQVFSAMSAVVKSKLQQSKDQLSTNKIQLTSKEENKSYIEQTLRSLKANNKEKLVQLEIKKAELETKLQAEKVSIESLESIRDKMLEQDIDLTPIKAKHTKLISIKAKMEGNRERFEKDNTFFETNDNCPTCRQAIDQSFKKDTISNNQSKIAELDDGLNKVTEQIDLVIAEIDKIDKVIKNINGIKVDITSAKSTYNNLHNNLNQVIEYIESLSTSDKTTQESERQLQAVEYDISTLQKEKEALLDDRQYIDLATVLLKDGGIKTKIIKQYLPIINKHINKYLTKLGFFVNFNINESFEETIKSRYRDEFSYNNFSEGEKLRIDLAILLTWRQIAKLKNSVNVNIIVFDEILDRAMDNSGIDEFMKIMWEDLGKDSNVFVISHKEVMAERFQRTLRFDKTKNFSTMTKEV